MEDELQHILSKLSVCDLNMVLYYTNGDRERAANTILQLQHERMGQPAEMLIRSLRNYDGALYDNNKNRPPAPCINPRQLGRMVTSSSSTASVVDRQIQTKNRGSCNWQAPTRHDSAMAYSSPLCAVVPMPPHSLHKHKRERHNAKDDRSIYSAEIYNDRRIVSSGQADRFHDYDNTFLPPARSCKGEFSLGAHLVEIHGI